MNLPQFLEYRDNHVAMLLPTELVASAVAYDQQSHRQDHATYCNCGGTISTCPYN